MSINTSINTNTAVINKKMNQPATSFKGTAGVVNALTKSMQWCDKNPMYGISTIDVTSMIGPRTFIDTMRNGFAGAETFVRESSGLVINCLTPGFIVLGLANLLKDKTMGSEFKAIKSQNIWADENTIKALTKSWKDIPDVDSPDKVKKFVTSILDGVEGVDGGSKKFFKDLSAEKKKSVIAKISDLITSSEDKIDKKVLKEVHGLIADELKISRSISVNLEKAGKTLNSSVDDLLRDVCSMGKAFMNDAVNPSTIDNFSSRLTKLVKNKSFIGLGVVCVLASSVQAVNRYITEKRSGVSGFCGYKDFGKNERQEETKKGKLNFKKILSSLGMAGLALFSMKGFKPSMLQFKGVLPTLNQCRLISAVTIIGRILASSDENELRETTFRDYLGFANLYILGDYVAKGVASLMEKGNKNIKLLNKKAVDVAPAGMIAKAKHWITNVNLKSFEEVSKTSTKHRAVAQMAGLLYACLSLGIFVPILNKKMTEKNAQNQQNKAATNPINNDFKFFEMMSKIQEQKTREIYASFLKH